MNHIIYDFSKLDLKKDSIVTIGKFDSVHKGHQKLIKYTVEYAKKHNLISIAIVIKKKNLSIYNTDLHDTSSLFSRLQEKVRTAAPEERRSFSSPFHQTGFVLASSPQKTGSYFISTTMESAITAPSANELLYILFDTSSKVKFPLSVSTT